MINILLQQLLLKIQTVLSCQLVGLYIGGSIATNSFNNETSDIDCYVITEHALSKNIIQHIEAMHKAFYLSEIVYARKVEVSYIPKASLVNFNPQDRRPYFNEGNFYLAPYGNNFIIELYVLREKGISVFGPNIKLLTKEITVSDLRLAIHRNLIDYWQPMLANLEKLQRDDYQVFGILTMCRILYTLETNLIASKKEAAQWAVKNLNRTWKELIEKALCWQAPQQFNQLEATQQFISYVLNKSKQH